MRQINGVGRRRNRPHCSTTRARIGISGKPARGVTSETSGFRFSAGTTEQTTETGNPWPGYQVAFRFRWFSCKMRVQCPPQPLPEMRRQGTAGPLGNPIGTPIPVQLQTALQQALDDYHAPLRPLPPGHASPPSLRPRHCHQFTAKSASKSRGSAAASVAVWPAV